MVNVVVVKSITSATMHMKNTFYMNTSANLGSFCLDRNDYQMHSIKSSDNW